MFFSKCLVTVGLTLLCLPVSLAAQPRWKIVKDRANSCQISVPESRRESVVMARSDDTVRVLTTETQTIVAERILENTHTCDLKGALNDVTMKWDGKEFTIDELETSPDGKNSMWHEVWFDMTSTSLTQTGDTGVPGGTFNRILTIHGTRAASKESSAEKPERTPTGEFQATQTDVSFPWGGRP